MTPDFSPIMGIVPSVEGFILDVGWGTYGFKAGAGGRQARRGADRDGQDAGADRAVLARAVLDGQLIGEKAAAAVSH